MFQSARITLTAWYLLIIMVISILFSFAVYTSETSEIEHLIGKIQYRDEHPHGDMPDKPPPPDQMKEPSLRDLQDTKEHLLFKLIFINIGILFVAGGAGYFLADRTLQPIKYMMDEQNQFITNASHELRTPIATLRAEMEGSLLEKHLTDKQARDLIISNIEELDSLQALTNNLLDLAHVHTIDPDAYKDKVNLQELIDAATKHIAIPANKKNITIQNDSESVHVQGNKSKLLEVFIILLDNAIKYSPDNTKIQISTYAKNQTVTIDVADEGIGIAEVDIQHIFNRFYRADKSRNEDGFGLGLSIAKKIIEAHNGSITVKSALKKGTTFSIHLNSYHQNN